MKIKQSFSRIPSGRAFTLMEMMIAGTVVMMVIAGLLTTHLCGLRMFQVTTAKISANQDGRKAISEMTDEIRGAKWLLVGNWDSSTKKFTAIEDGQPQVGNALEIYNTPTNTPFIRYYLEAQELRRVTNNTMTPLKIAHSVTNAVIFSSENYKGQPITTNENNRVIGMNLQFYQIQYPIIKIGPGQYYEYYQLSTRITRRTLE